jgi:hypothetical protein
MAFSVAHENEIALRRKFTDQEDLQLRDLVEHLGSRNWEDIARFMPSRTARQCRDRYNNYLLNSLVTAPWTPVEDAILIEQYHQIGPYWSEIAKLLNGRSGNHIKNRWRRHLAHQHYGMSPVTPIAQTKPSEVKDFVEPPSEDEKKTASGAPTVLLCPELHLGQCDWSRMFDWMDDAFGYGAVARNSK